MEYIGREVAKTFKNHGTFKGKVLDYDKQHGFHVEYEDGDSEDMKESDLLKILTKTMRLDGPACLSGMSRRSTPRCETVPQYLQMARHAARRKRKHTELKRSGLLDQRRAAAEAKAAKKAAAAAAAEASKVPLHPPPPWAEGMSVEPKLTRFTAPEVLAVTSHDHEASLYRLQLAVQSETSCLVRWWFPTGNPGNSGAWIALHPAGSVEWLETHGTTGGNKLIWRLITKNAGEGSMTFSKLSTLKDGIADGVYVYTLHIDYGTNARACSERFVVKGGRIVTVYQETGLVSECEKMVRKKRQQDASLGLMDLTRVKDDDAEILDDRCYFPVVNVDMTLADKYADALPMLKQAYRVVDKESFLDWGLSSDYQMDQGGDGGEGGDGANFVEAGGHKLRKAKASASKDDVPELKLSHQYSNLMLPSASQRASRASDGRGLGGGTKGSEGYGEATMGSAQKVGVLCAHLRSLVLQHLHDTHWNLLWDLGPHSTFLDIGSGYGKVNLHIRLLTRCRRSAGYECVKSRDEIAKKALHQLESEAAALPGGGAGMPAAAAAAAASSSSSNAPLVESESAESQSAETASSSEGDGASSTAAVEYLPMPALSGCEFKHCDVTTVDCLQFTHVYIFDWVFSQHTLAEIAPVLQRSSFYVLISFRKVSEWWGHGLIKIQPVAKLTGFRTNGGEGMTAYIYINLEKVPQV